MFGRGRGYRRMYYATGLPGWARGFGAGYGRGGRGNPYSYCRWFPQLPREWWTGMYGPVEMTPQGPVLTQQKTQQIGQPTQQAPGFPAQFPGITKDQEIQALRQEKGLIKRDLEEIEKRLKELESNQ